MNHMQPQKWNPELLAAYADGEITGEALHAFEAWLEEHPEAYEELLRQRELSPTNDEFWHTVAPPEPDAAQWGRLLNNIKQNCAAFDQLRHKRLWQVKMALGAASLAAIVFFAVFSLNQARHTIDHRFHTESTLALSHDDESDTLYPIANEDDVQLIGVPETAMKLIVVGRHPVAGDPVELANWHDVDIVSGETSNSYNTRVELSSGPGFPILVAVPNRP